MIANAQPNKPVVNNRPQLGKRSITLSGIQHLVNIVNQNSALTGLSSFTKVIELGRQARAAVTRSKCNCSANKIYSNNKQVFDATMAAMGNGDHIMVKNILKVDEICYYVNKSNGLVLQCI